MTVKTHHGGCHCGAVSYEADIDLAASSTTRCNCSICSKARAWFVIVKPDKVRLIQGEGAMADYQWNPPGQDQPHLHYRFCKTCGVRAFASADSSAPGGAFYAIAVSTLEDADPDELAASIKYVDGRSGHYDRQPDDIRLM
jgi:hypothetical protein